MIVLYYFYPGCSLAAHIALEESGLPFEARRVDLKDPAQAAEYKKINPKGTVPAITLDGQMLSENVAIMAYVADQAPKAGLLPTDPMARAQCLSFLVWGASTIHINFRQSFRPERFTADTENHDGIRAAGRAKYWENLQFLDQRLQGQDWIMGKDFTCADGYVLRFYDWARISKHPVDELKALTAHKDRMVARATVRRVLEREGSPLVGAA
jgi:glutathione S-transferase